MATKVQARDALFQDVINELNKKQGKDETDSKISEVASSTPRSEEPESATYINGDERVVILKKQASRWAIWDNLKSAWERFRSPEPADHHSYNS